MKVKLQRISALLWVLAIFLVCLVPVQNAKELPSIQIPVSITAEGTLPRNGEKYTILISADGDKNPMPYAQVGGIFELTLNGVGDSAIPPISFSELGYYTYTISQVAGTYKDCKYDERVYSMRVRVSQSVDGGHDIAVVLHEIGKDTKPISAEFHNVYKTVSKPPLPPKTGTDGNLLMWCIIMSVSGVGMIFAVLFGKSRKSKYR